MIAVIDYDAGNLKSVEKALIFLGETPVITRDREELLAADKVILPGVGAFGGCHGPSASVWTGGCDKRGCKKRDSFSWHLPGTAADV